MGEGMTNAQFSQQCSFIAKECASWAGDSLTLPELFMDPIRGETVSRFTDGIRARLDRIDEWAGRSLTTPEGE